MSTSHVTNSPVISVFGSSAPRPGQPDYIQAMQVGAELARAGYTVATGGYGGTMEAVSRGANEAGGHVIGVSCDQIEAYRAISPNPWIKEEIRYATLQKRLLHLVTVNEGMITLPGGVGTLTELSLAWGFIQVGEVTPRPLVALGAIWRDLAKVFVKPAYVDASTNAILRFANTPLEAVMALKD